MTIYILTETILIKMSILNQKDEFIVLERHKNYNIKFMSATKVNKNAKLTLKNVLLTDFEQGKIGNCGLIATLGAISQRPEFLSEIAPKVERTSEGVKFYFNMFYKGKPTVVTIDDKLPFINPSFFEWLFFDKRPSLIYARSSNDDNLYLASLFEKAVVKLVCNNDYKNSDGIPSRYVFSLFSDCMVSYCDWLEKDLKQNVIDHLKYEFDNKNSVVLVITPDLTCEPEDIGKAAHAYVVMDYNLEHKAIKLYNQNMCTNYFLDHEKNLPLLITETADPNKGERWITLYQLEKRRLSINSLCSKNLYKSVFKTNKNFKSTSFNKNYCAVKYSCKIHIKENSTFLINLFLFSHPAAEFRLNIITTDTERQKVETNFELLRSFLLNRNKNNGVAKGEYYQRFDLKPNNYIFQFEGLIEKSNLDELEFLLKIGSVSECSFEEVVEEDND